MDMQGRESKIRITIESNLEDVVIVASVARQVCARLSLSCDECDDVGLSVSEAVNNAIIHAYKCERGHEIEVRMSTKGDRLLVEVCDEGKEMARSVSLPFVFNPADRESLPEGGMGLFIINRIMDKVMYRTENGKNILTMVRQIDPEGPIK